MSKQIKELTLDEIHEEHLIMLKKVTEFCKKHNLRYYLAGGTLLGAIRHKGFIPWDTDVDIIMPRPDVEKLEKIAKENDYHIDDLVVTSFRLGNLKNTYCKVFNTNIKTDYMAKNELERCLWLDIFPIDGISENKIEENVNYHKAHIIKRIIRTIIYDSSKQDKKVKNIIKTIIMYIFKNKVDALSAKLEEMATRYDYDSSKYVGVITWGQGSKEKMLLSEMEDLEVDFEGEKFNVMACYDKYLSNMYGDYMKLPPVEERNIHLKTAIKTIEE